MIWRRRKRRKPKEARAEVAAGQRIERNHRRHLSIFIVSTSTSHSFSLENSIASMANLNFSYSSAKTRTIEEIRFGVFSPKESERLAVIDIEYPEFTYVEIATTSPLKSSF